MKLEGTLFQVRVWKEMMKIPKGKTITYGELAKRVGKPKAARAVANVCAANKYWPTVPCHRVVANNGIGGFSGPGGVKRKRELLKKEGITF